MPLDIWHSMNDEPSPRLKLALASTFVAFLGVNYASNAGVLGNTNAEVSARYPTPLTPQGWAFSIWGLIFLLQAIGVGVVLCQREDPDGARQRVIKDIAAPWIFGWTFAALWQFAFVQSTPLSMWFAVLLISLSLASLLTGTMRLYKQYTAFGSSNSVLLYAAFTLPTSVMSAWLSVATAVQILIAFSTQMQSLDTLAIALALLVTAGGLWAVVLHKDSAYALTLLWAFVAVFEKTQSVAVKHTVVVGMVVVILGFIVSVVARRERLPSPSAAQDGAERQHLLRQQQQAE